MQGLSVRILLTMAFLLTAKAGGADLFFYKYEPYITWEQFSELQRMDALDKYVSDKRLGAFVENGETLFRLFAPQALAVTLCTFEEPEGEGNEFTMTRDDDGVWEVSLKGELYGTFYGYKLKNPERIHVDDNLICLDPYAKAVAGLTGFMTPRLGIVVKEDDYDWEGDTWINRDWRDLVIYEMHIRDMTKHESAGASKPGTYEGLTEKGIKGGIDYIKSLGVNTVELLPAMEFANLEIPYKDSLHGRCNTWNPYEQNHWGYMTAAFFAPETYYTGVHESFPKDLWMGKEDKARRQFKDMVKAFHDEGIAVMMDVVYNHISEYEFGNFKEIDKEYYFRLDANGDFISESYCGNDFKTERPMARRLIVESVLYWMKEYNIDGFRFDLGHLIDWGTIEAVIHEAKKVNPDVIIVCEPWGGGYDPNGFSQRGWGSWNDQIRNGIKGENPFDGLGWIFGEWYGNNSRDRVKSYVNGTLTRDSLGLFLRKEHSVNYLESHDGYTLGDFIRLGLGDVKKDEVITDIDEVVKLTDKQLRLNKLGALFLMTSQGITMIHSGQEYARSKVLPHVDGVKDSHEGMLDHNTYNKDNEANYINYNHAETNRELLDYYRGLIELRSTYDAFRHADYEAISFIEPEGNKFAIGFTVDHEGEIFTVLFNADKKLEQSFELGDGEWEALVNPDRAGVEALDTVSGKVMVQPQTGWVFRKK